jgi:hypothetical protein
MRDACVDLINHPLDSNYNNSSNTNESMRVDLMRVNSLAKKNNKKKKYILSRCDKLQRRRRRREVGGDLMSNSMARYKRRWRPFPCQIII